MTTLIKEIKEEIKGARLELILLSSDKGSTSHEFLRLSQ